MQVSVKNDLAKLEKQLNKLGKKAFIPSLNSALNREGNRAKTESIREVSKVQEVKQKLLKEKTRVRRSNFRTLTYEIDFDYRGITWSRLNPKVIGGTKRGRGRGVRAGQHRHRHGFIRNVRGGRWHNGAETTQVLIKDVNHPKYDGKRYPLRVLRVRLRQPIRIAFESRSKEARARVLRELEREIGRRTQKMLEKAK